MTEGKKRVALYARVSTPDQTPENQLLDMRKHCAARGWTIVKEFVDIGISGAKKDRPNLNALMEAVRKRLVDGVLVWRFDRFARSLSHLVNTLEEFNERRVSFTSYSENIDTGTAQGKMVFAVMAALAEFERQLIIERINAGIRRARDQGTHLGRPGLPESTVAAIRDMREREHLSYKAIATKLELSKSVVGKILKVRKSSTKHDQNVAPGVDGASVAS